MSIRVCVAGVSGWTGRAVAHGILQSKDLVLTGAVARSAAGASVAEVLGRPTPVELHVTADLSRALRNAQVLVDYTHPDAVKHHVLTALDAGVAVVVGTSGLTADDYRQIEVRAIDRGLGVVAAGNFSVTAALLKHFALIAARYVPHWEVVDLAGAGKPDAPSGTARELAEALGDAGDNRLAVPPADTRGIAAARGATVGGAQVHSVRLPGYTLSVEALFGLAGERLSIRHDAGDDAAPYVAGTLLAVRRAVETVGLVRGLDRLLFG